MSSSLQSVIPFNEHTTRAFLEWIQSPQHVNRQQMSYTDRAQLMLYCLSPNEKCQTPAQRYFKRRSKEYLVIEDRLHRHPDVRNTAPRLVILAKETLSTVARIHQQLGHTGYKKTFAAVEK